MSTKYAVVYSRDESGWWQARVPTVPGCHTQGRTVDEARRRIREALSLFVDDAARATLVDDVALPADAKKVIRAYVTHRRRAITEEQEASFAARMAVKKLRHGPLKLSVRDAAEMLGVSYQRVQQLSKEPAPRRK